MAVQQGRELFTVVPGQVVVISVIKINGDVVAPWRISAIGDAEVGGGTEGGGTAWKFLMVLNKSHMERGVYLASGPIIAPVSFGAEVVADKDTFYGAGINFWVVFVLNEHEATAANLTHVSVIGCTPVPGFVRRDGLGRRDGGSFVVEMDCG